ncbi:MAG: S9 family peptidase [Sphingomonadaceae bacterium]|nr:S9 family peptidase [Sphingomonadaceae bacterium]
MREKIASRWRLASTAGMIAIFGSMAMTAEAAPIEAYGRLPSVDDVTISPGGTRIAFLVGDASTRQIQVRKTEDLTQIGVINLREAKIIGLDWADESNLLLVSAKAATVMGLEGPSREWWLAYDYDLGAGKLHALLTDTDIPMNVIQGWPQARKIGNHTTLFLTGVSFLNNQSVLTMYRQVLPGSAEQVFQGEEKTSDLLIDTNGKTAARVDYDEQSGQWSLLSHANGNWHVIDRETAPIDTPTLEGFGRTEDTLIVQEDGDDGTRYREIPIAGGTLSPPIAALDGATLIKDPVKRTVIGGAVTDEMAERYSFFDPKDQILWEKVNRAFPGETVRLASWSDDRTKIILQVEGSKNGAAYFRLDARTGRADWIADEYAGIGPEDLGEVRVIHYNAADGRELPAYLTLPRGAVAKNLPLVVLPHGGPAARDDPGFDWWAQAIASLGYAVLQPQFRGSSGFEHGLLAAGYGEWGRKMQTDLSDGVHYLASGGIVDPSRVCIVGASYGGYAAMAGVTLQSGVYKCAVAVAGVSDLRQFLSSRIDSTGGAHNSTLRFWQRFMGTKSSSDPALDALSPARHADKLSAPLLLIHGTVDTIVPFEQSRIMFNAAKRASKPVQLVTLSDEDHNLSRSATRLQMLQAMAAFLRTNLPTIHQAAQTADASGSKPKAAAN